MELLHCVYEPEGEGPHPTILALHGRGANAMDLLGLAPHLCGGAFRFICPQAPLEVALGPGMTGYAWFPMSTGGDIDTAAFLSARDRLRAFVEPVRRDGTPWKAASSSCWVSARAAAWPTAWVCRSRTASPACAS